MIKSVLTLLLLLSNPSHAEELSLPEFECLLVKIENKQAARHLLGDAERPSLGLRRTFLGKWILRVQNTNSMLENAAVSKFVSLTSARFTYEIRDAKQHFRVELMGKPPSRHGKIWQEALSPKVPVLLGDVTCH